MAQLLDRLYSINLFSEKNGLESMVRLCEHAGHPERKFRSVHIAGSNGKGSVSTKIASGLQASGFRVGLFTSPHIERFNERIKINGMDIDDVSLNRYLQRTFELVDKHQIPATYFEIVTLTAFLYYADQQVDFTVFEVGLGGRFDATNVILPDVSVITSISLEHTDILGDTIDAITRQKAGIIKTNVPVVIGPTVPAAIIKEYTTLIEIVEGTFETFFEENNAVARRAMEILGLGDKSITEGLKASPRCRMQIIANEITIIRDGGHNPAAIKHLLIALEKKQGWKKFHILCSFSSNKDIKSCLALLQPVCETITFLEPAHTRLATVKMMEVCLPDGMRNTRASFKELKRIAKKTGYPILITGSFYIMTDQTTQ